MLGLVCVCTLSSPPSNPPSDIIIDPPPLTPSARHNRPTNSSFSLSLCHGFFFPFPLSIPTLSLSLLFSFVTEHRSGGGGVPTQFDRRERETPSVSSASSL